MGNEGAQSGYEQAIARVLERLDITGLPMPAKPKDYGAEYDYPADPSVLTSTGLGQLKARLTGWHGYAIRLIAIAEVPHDLLATSFNIALGRKMNLIADRPGEKRQLKDTLRAAALESDPVLESAARKLAEWAAYIKVLKAQASIFEMQAKSLSREQSRRSDEIRMRQGSGG